MLHRSPLRSVSNSNLCFSRHGHACSHNNRSSFSMTISRDFAALSTSLFDGGSALVAGSLFGAGLVLSGMTNPDKVIAFLTVNHNWDASLIFVMGCAVLLAGVGYSLANRRNSPLLDINFHEPVAQAVDRRLIIGSALFGTGWAVSGYCPGPAIVGSFLVDERAAIFLGAYLAGIGIFEMTRARTAVALADG